MHKSTYDIIDQASQSFEEKEPSISKRVSDLGQSSARQFLLEDKPKSPVTIDNVTEKISVERTELNNLPVGLMRTINRMKERTNSTLKSSHHRDTGMTTKGTDESEIRLHSAYGTDQLMCV